VRTPRPKNARAMQVGMTTFHILDLTLFVTCFGGFKKCSWRLSLQDGILKGTHKANKKVLMMSGSDNLQPSGMTFVIKIRHGKCSDRIAYNGRQSRAQLNEA